MADDATEAVHFEDGVEYGDRVHPTLHLLAPFLAIGGTWVARQGINVLYEKIAGHPAPRPSDPRTTWGRAILWTAVTAATVAIIEVAIYRVSDRREILEGGAIPAALAVSD